MSIKSVRARITGRVQGVWYRAWTAQTAKGFGLSGWVRNLQDGSVEAVFSGPEDKVDAMLDACRLGPPMARVSDIETSPEEAPVDADFTQRETV